MNDTELLELERNKLKLVLSLIDDAVVLVDTSQNIFYVNESCARMLGVSQNEVLGKPVNEVFVILDNSNQVVLADNYCPTGDIDIQGTLYKNSELKLVDANNKVIKVSLESRKMKGGSQMGIGCVVAIKDVGKKQQLENMKIDFTSMAVHELRTPLTVLRGFLNDLSRGDTLSKLDESELDSLNNAIAGANDLSTFIEDLLHLSEISEGSFKVKFMDINYEGLVASVVLEHQKAASAKDLKILYNAPLYQFPLIQADFERVKELLSNLIANAIKFTDKGFIEITLSKDDKYITTVVSDTGKGIPRERQATVFQKFTREKENPLEMSTGYGLGLFICRKIVESHKGKIWVESQENVGSSFYFTLPIK